MISQQIIIHFNHIPCFIFALHPNLSQAITQWINLPLPQLTYWMTSHLFTHIYPLSNPIIPNSFNMTKLSESAFINPFIQPFPHSTQFSYPCIQNFIHSPYTQQTSKVIHLRILDLSSHYHTIEEPQGVLHAAPLQTQITNPYHPPTTFLWHLASSVLDSSKTDPKYLNWYMF